MPLPDQRSRLKGLLAAVLVALLVPAVVLAWLGYRQLRFEAFYLQQTRAAELTQAIDRRATALFAAEDARAFADFAFLIVGEGNFVQRSPLSGYPVEGALPGLVSYFQVDADGAFSTPLLPADDDATWEEPDGAMTSADRAARQALQDRVRLLLAGPALPEEEKAVTGSATTGRSSGEQDLDEAVAGAVVAAAPAERGALKDANERADTSLDEVRAPVPASRQALAQRSEPPPAGRDEQLNAELAQGQRAFQRLNAPKEKTDSPLGSVADLKLEETFAKAASVAADAEAPAAVEAVGDESMQSPQTEVGGKPEQRARRAEKSVAYTGDRIGRIATEPGVVVPAADQPFTFFESEVDPFRFDLLDADHFVLHRTAWRDGQRYVQGAVIERPAFISQLIATPYRESALAYSGRLVVAHRGEVLQSYAGSGDIGYASAATITGTLLYRARLSAPLNDVELIFGFQRLPTGPGASLIGWTLTVFVVLLVAGFYLLYRLGVRQITLGEQQQDFVSAVSHELKTPLTSIRMYGEMLKAGWVTEEKRREYYGFIFSESERLTRLINNVLRLARFDRNGADLDLRTITAGELADLARSKIASQIEQAGFALEESHLRPDAVLEADADAFIQIAINLVDNALKFSAGAETRKITFTSRVVGDQIEFAIRDFGPGVPRNQMKKIFELFYRTERELTRETVGTGIGLALVHELATGMGGSVDVRNAEPGAEFRVRLPLASKADG
jgi:two-component system phosphate regulon sensor histidine kinase PhoR